MGDELISVVYVASGLSYALLARKAGLCLIRDTNCSLFMISIRGS